LLDVRPFTIDTLTTTDGYPLKYRRYSPAEAPKAQVIVIHGIQSHAGWYQYSCRQLCGAGYEVCFLDRRGAGLNDKNRGDAPSFRRLLDDLAEQVGAIKASDKWNKTRLPVFLAAISWGGKLGLALQRRHPRLVDGMALLCPGLFASVRPTFRERVAIARARLTSPHELFPIPLNDPALFTASPKWQQFIADDPLSLRQATARLLVESVRLGGYLRFCRKYVTLPLLLMLAEKDRIIDNARTRSYFAKLPAADKVVIEYPGAHHTLEFEPAPDTFIADLIEWLNKRTAGTLANRSLDR
jgi:alpha-beta hydrolase superfamily lysophospholipase